MKQHLFHFLNTSRVEWHSWPIDAQCSPVMQCVLTCKVLGDTKSGDGWNTNLTITRGVHQIPNGMMDMKNGCTNRNVALGRIYNCHLDQVRVNNCAYLLYFLTKIPYIYHQICIKITCVFSDHSCTDCLVPVTFTPSHARLSSNIYISFPYSIDTICCAPASVGNFASN